MTININIYPGKPAKNGFLSLFCRLNWRDENGYNDTRRSLGYTIHKAEWNKAAMPFMINHNGITKTIFTNITGTSDEATLARDHAYKIKQFAKSLDFETSEKNISALFRFIDNLKNGDNIGLTMKTLPQFIEKFINIKTSAYSYNRIRKYKTLQRNVLLFCAWKKYSGNMFEMTSDQQSVFFSEYVDFLINTMVTKSYKDDRMVLMFGSELVKPTEVLALFFEKQEKDVRKKVKDKYQNSSVKGDFDLITAIGNQFETGLLVEPADFCRPLKVGETKGTHCTLDELIAIWNTPRRTLTEEKTISIFVFICFTGIRTETVYEVENQNITNMMTPSGPIKVLNYTADKEGNTATVPLNKICLDIIEHWGGQAFKVPERRDTKNKKTNYYPNCLLPVISFSQMNETLHEFLKRVPGMDSISREVRWSGTNKIDNRLPRYQEITMYAARHTYSHLLTSGGITLDEAGPLMSHKSSETTKKNYSHLEQNKITEKAYGVMEALCGRFNAA